MKEGYGKLLKDQWDIICVDGDTGLMLLNNRQILVPKTAVKRLMRLLHQGHCGFTKTYALAQQYYYWPGMRNDIMQMVSSCVHCQRT